MSNNYEKKNVGRQWENPIFSFHRTFDCIPDFVLDHHNADDLRMAFLLYFPFVPEVPVVVIAMIVIVLGLN